MRYSPFFLLIPLFFALLGCGADTGTKVLDGEVRIDPDVGTDVNDPAAMEELMNADPSAP